MAKYLNDTGLAYFWGKIKDRFQVKAVALSLTLTVAGWSASSQVLTANGVTTTNVVIVSPTVSDQDNYISAGIKCSAQNTNQLTFICETTPTADIHVSVVIL